MTCAKAYKSNAQYRQKRATSKIWLAQVSRTTIYIVLKHIHTVSSEWLKIIILEIKYTLKDGARLFVTAEQSEQFLIALLNEVSNAESNRLCAYDLPS